MQTIGDTARRGCVDDSVVDESLSPTDLAALPDAVRAVLEEFRAEVAASSRKEEPSTSDSEELPYACRMYESVPGEEELLQLQWMRIDMSEMDSERCWAEPSGCDEEYDCGPDSGLVLPAVYRVDPVQLFPLTFVGIPPELSRTDRGSDGSKLLATDEVPEDHLCQIGRDLTGALATQTGRRGEGLPPDIVTEVASLAATDWSTCLERHVDFSRRAASSSVVLCCVPCADGWLGLFDSRMVETRLNIHRDVREIDRGASTTCRRSIDIGLE